MEYKILIGIFMFVCVLELLARCVEHNYRK